MMFGEPSTKNALWLLAGGFLVGVGWHIAAILVSRIF